MAKHQTRGQCIVAAETIALTGPNSLLTCFPWGRRTSNHNLGPVRQRLERISNPPTAFTAARETITAQHCPVNEALWRRDEVGLKQIRSYALEESRTQEGDMRKLIFGFLLIAIASIGFYSLISASLAAARDARPATFAERFAPALKSTDTTGLRK